MSLEFLAMKELERRLERLADAVEILALELPPTRMMDVMAILDEVRGE